MLETILAILLMLLDRATKLWAMHSLQFMPGGMMEVIPGVVEFRYLENRGAAFSILWGQQWFFILSSVIVTGILIWFLTKYRREEALLTRVAVSSIIAGAVGNLIDRLCYGFVVDFINPTFIYFAVFNIADIYITLGTIVFIFAFLVWTPHMKKKKGIDGTADHH